MQRLPLLRRAYHTVMPLSRISTRGRYSRIEGVIVEHRECHNFTMSKHINPSRHTFSPPMRHIWPRWQQRRRQGSGWGGTWYRGEHVPGLRRPKPREVRSSLWRACSWHSNNTQWSGVIRSSHNASIRWRARWSQFDRTAHIVRCCYSIFELSLMLYFPGCVLILKPRWTSCKVANSVRTTLKTRWTMCKVANSMIYE